jgi:cell division protein ZapA
VAQVAVRLNGRDYVVTCDDGEEAHVERLAAYVDAKLAELAHTVGQVGDARLLVMASILVADELDEAKNELARLKHGQANAETHEGLEALARRIENIAARLENT